VLTLSVNPPYGQLFEIFFIVFLTPDNEYMCFETDLAQEKGNFPDDHLYVIPSPHSVSLTVWGGGGCFEYQRIKFQSQKV